MKQEIRYSAKNPKSYRIDKNGWQFVHLEGAATERF